MDRPQYGHGLDDRDDFFDGLELPSRLQTGPRPVYVDVLNREVEGEPKRVGQRGPECEVYRLTPRGGRVRRANCGHFPAAGDIEEFAEKFGPGDYAVALRAANGAYLTKGTVAVDADSRPELTPIGPAVPGELVAELRTLRMDLAAGVGRLEEMHEEMTARQAVLDQRLDELFEIVDESAQQRNRAELVELVRRLRGQGASDDDEGNDGDDDGDIMDQLQAMVMKGILRASQVKELIQAGQSLG